MRIFCLKGQILERHDYYYAAKRISNALIINGFIDNMAIVRDALRTSVKHIGLAPISLDTQAVAI